MWPLRGSIATLWVLPASDVNAVEEKGAAEARSASGWRHVTLFPKQGSNKRKGLQSTRTMAVGSFLAAFAAVSLLWGPARAQIRSVVLDKQSGRLSVVEGLREDFVAWANFTDDVHTSG